MKKLVLTVLCLATLFSCSIDEKSVDMTQSEVKLKSSPNYIPLESTAIFLAPRTKVDDKETLTIFLANFSDEELSTSYIIQGVEIFDDGQDFDQVAGDGYYTSKEVFTPKTDNFEEINYVYTGEEFMYENELNEFIKANSEETLSRGGKPKPTGSIKIKGGCKIRYTYKGESSLGIPCSWGGCVEFYDWKGLEMEFELGLEI